MTTTPSTNRNASLSSPRRRRADRIPRRHELRELARRWPRRRDGYSRRPPTSTAARTCFPSLDDATRALPRRRPPYHRDDPFPAAASPARSARYARGEDYHLVLRDRLVALSHRLADALGQPVACAVRPTPRHPLAEWAERGGLVHREYTMLIAPVLGGAATSCSASSSSPRPADSLGLLAPYRHRTALAYLARACLDACPTTLLVDAYGGRPLSRPLASPTLHRASGVRSRGELRASIGTWVSVAMSARSLPFNAGACEPPSPCSRPGRGNSLCPISFDLAAIEEPVRRFVRRTAMRHPREVWLSHVAVALGNTGATPRSRPRRADREARRRSCAPRRICTRPLRITRPHAPPPPPPPPTRCTHGASPRTRPTRP